MAFREADAEALPFADGGFDAALSTFGVMFTPDHVRAAGEMLRVVRPGGRIGLANWTPEGFIGQLFKTIGQHLPPPAGLKSPGMWGNEEYLNGLFGAQAAHIHAERKIFNFRYASAAHWLQVFRDFYGPVHKAFAALDAGAGQALEHDIMALLERFNTAGQASLVVPAEYLEVVIRKR
ncbi:Methyltransferase domain-containing protein [Pseudoduganella namucuonensis]|uniref:Methyltransferase domain-containing protein n=1 Tax=Pseudoduganella namucuonensis TaxID=1035707 RepID=A0A1I7IL08_9BURK|nr:Methyltransferase domain-containing protein [Pseudoduganella namucuonensis]